MALFRQKPKQKNITALSDELLSKFEKLINCRSGERFSALKYEDFQRVNRAGRPYCKDSRHNEPLLDICLAITRNFGRSKDSFCRKYQYDHLLDGRRNSKTLLRIETDTTPRKREKGPRCGIFIYSVPPAVFKSLEQSKKLQSYVPPISIWECDFVASRFLDSRRKKEVIPELTINPLYSLLNNQELANKLDKVIRSEIFALKEEIGPALKNLQHISDKIRDMMGDNES